MTTPRADVDAVVAGLQARWGAAAPRVVGALALAPVADATPTAGPALIPTPDDGSRPDLDRVIPTGFAALDAIL
ncbi:MAG TPA: hypothetical protein VFV29_07765, partial [Actinomycetota bacterium]|nr:hypothetical protein [Actinomycetota bacterium]